MKKVGILGVGRYLPEQVVTNHDLERKTDTDDEWIRTRTGIEERRFAPENIRTSDMAFYAAKEAIDSSGISAEEIGMIIVATITPDQAFPSVSCLLQERLGIPTSPAFDISAACSGFLYALDVAKQFVENGAHSYVLVVGAEKLSTLIDWNDRGTCVLFGDGAGAVVLGEVNSDKGILAIELGADGSGGKHLYSNPRIVMNGREVFKFAVNQMSKSTSTILAKAGLEAKDVDFLVPHQANIRIIDAARERLELPPEKASTTIRQHGNTSAASIPLALYEEVKNGRIRDGHTIVLVGFGGGLTWGSLCMIWGS